MKKRMFRYLFIALALAGVVAVVIVFLNMRPVNVTLVRAEQNVTIRVFGLGTIEARVVSKIGFEVGAAIVELKADHGDRVRKGEVLARLYSVEQEAKLVKAKAGVLNAEVNLKRTQANVAKAQAVLAQKQAANRRKQELVGRRVISDQLAEEAVRDEAVAKADLAVALSETEVARAQIADARAQLEIERTLLARHVLTAPFDAVVVTRHQELGTVVKAGDAIFTLVAPETVWVLAYIDESRAGPIAVGQAAIVRLRSRPQAPIRGKVARIGIESDRVNEERRVYVKCEQCPPSFHLGEQAEVLVTVAKLKTALLVPEIAVQGFDGAKGKVWTVEGGSLKRRTLSFRYRTEDARLEVVGGLPQKARIVANIEKRFRVGRAVRIRDAVRTTGAGR
ncbi:MAG: efflux RND transporter periplasmic adaptor subunit [Alphaproteobacteria bacterium]